MKWGVADASFDFWSYPALDSLVKAPNRLMNTVLFFIALQKAYPG